MLRVTAVIVTYQSEKVLERCLRSLYDQVLPPAEIFIVDNASTDGTLDILCNYTDIRLRKNPANLGFAEGVNQGIREAKGDLILLINPDAWLDPAFLEILTPRFEENPNLGSAVGKVYSGSSASGGHPRIDTIGILLNLFRLAPKNLGASIQDNGRFDAPRPIFGPSAAVALWRRRTLEDVRVGNEFLDRDFFLYYEDVDLAWRASRRGWDSLHVPEAIAWHDRKGEERFRYRRPPFSVNKYYYTLKNASWLEIPPLLTVTLPLEAFKLALLSHPGSMQNLLDALPNLARFLKKRRAIRNKPLRRAGKL
ncbi:MAG: glycosyltransferase family 2 protein [Planctomycetota bacterium]|jgi:GT2 family glycosyltransferase